ncbi:MAG: hypothetical protein MMC23_008359 [Stictis urceolatum]|nr:hypothetical protein [Stictis urceolata]
MLTTILTAIGGLTATYFAYKALSFSELHFLRRSTLSRYLPALHSGPRAWALVTGASDGIGKGFAHELLSSGFNVVLHGRNQSKLSSVQSSLASSFPLAEVRVAVLDAHPVTRDGIDGLVSSLKDTPVTVLVNNVGGLPASATWRSLQELEHEDVDAVLDINARFPAQLTREMLPLLASPALVFNLSSAVARLPSPYLATYSACKAFNSLFSRALAAEVRAEGRDIEVLSLVVGEVASQWDPSERSFGGGKCSARTLARSALHKVGCGREEVVPYWKHDVMISVAESLPNWLMKRLVLKAARDGISRDRKGD